MRATYLSATTWLLIASSSFACPLCNIYNYLDNSVSSSTDIQLVEVVELKPGSASHVKIAEVIRGNGKVGDYSSQFLYNGETIGTKLLRCNPTNSGPKFPLIDVSLLAEVRLLASDKPEVKNAAHAVQCVQGISKVTTEMALNYIQAHYEDCREGLINAFNELYQARGAWPEKPFLDHQFEGLIKGLLLRPDPKSVEFLKSQIQRIASETETQLDPTQRPYRGELQGNILAALLDSGIDSASRDAFRTLMKEEIQNCASANARWFSYALGGILTPELLALLKTLPEERQQSVAWGIYDRSLYLQSWLDHESAKTCQEAALALSHSPQLQTAIEKDKARSR